MLKTGGVRLVLKLKSDRNGQICVKTAAHMRLDRSGHLLLYDASHRLTEEISLADHTVKEIIPVRWVREDVDFARPSRSTVTVRLAMLPS